MNFNWIMQTKYILFPHLEGKKWQSVVPVPWQHYTYDYMSAAVFFCLVNCCTVLLTPSYSQIAAQKVKYFK